MLFGQPCRELLHFCDYKAGEIPTNTSAASTNSTKHPGTTMAPAKALWRNVCEGH